MSRYPTLTRPGGYLSDNNLTDKQFSLATKARAYPQILATGGEKRTAASLEKNGWGTVEDGASGERIFRLNQDGEDALCWLDELAEDQHSALCSCLACENPFRPGAA